MSHSSGLARTIRKKMQAAISHPGKGFPGGSVVENPPANAGDVTSIPGSGRFPGERNGSPLCILAWEIPRTEEPGWLQSIGSQRIRHELSY